MVGSDASRDEAVVAVAQVDAALVSAAESADKTEAQPLEPLYGLRYVHDWTRPRRPPSSMAATAWSKTSLGDPYDGESAEVSSRVVHDGMGATKGVQTRTMGQPGRHRLPCRFVQPISRAPPHHLC